MYLKESYEKMYGEDLNWENLENFMLKVVRDQQTNIAEQYVENTTMTTGRFVGDKRVAEMIATSPLKENR